MMVAPMAMTVRPAPAPPLPASLPTPEPAVERPAMSPEAAARFRRMVEEQFDFIWRALRGLGVPAAGADDAAQQVFLIASQKMESIAVGSERSFLFSTAMGVAANARRSLHRRREVDDEPALEASVDDAPNPEQSVAQKQARAVLDRLMAEMPEDLRTVFMLFELEGMTTAQIAEVLAIPPGTAASRLRRAREDFQARAKRYQASGASGTRGGGAT